MTVIQPSVPEQKPINVSWDDFFGALKSKYASPGALFGASSAAQSAETMAYNLGQKLAQKTGKPQDIVLSAADAAKKTVGGATDDFESNLKAQHAASVAKSGQSQPAVSGSSEPAKPKPTILTPPAIQKTVVPMDYNANKYYLRPGESITDYTSRTTGTAPTDTSAPADGTMSSSDQQALNSAISSSDPADATSVMSSATDFFGGGSQLDTAVSDLMTQLLTPNNSFTNQYNQLLAQSGLTEDQTKLVNMQNIMNGSEDDIRAELTNAGGFATESQVQDMVTERNKNLEKQFNDLTNIANLKQGMLNTQIDLIEKDQTYKTTMLNTLTKLEEFGITKQTQFQNNTFNRLKWLASTGGLSNMTQEEAMLYSVGTGGQLSADEILAASKDPSSLKDLQIQIDEMRLEGINTKSSVTGATFSTALNQQVSRATTGFYGTSGGQRETVINVLQSEFPTMTSDQIQKAVYAQLPDGWDQNIKGRTASQLKSDETQNILSDISGGASLPQLIGAYPDVDVATLQSMFTANLTYGTAASSTGQ